MVEVTNPSEAFLAERMVNAPGSAIAVTMEGTRPLLVEIQGLTSPTSFGNPRRTPNGVDCQPPAVDRGGAGPPGGGGTVGAGCICQRDRRDADRRAGCRPGDGGGDRLLDEGRARASADTVLIGEVGLSGELRMVGQMSARLREAAKLGFRQAIVPRRIHPMRDGVRRKGEPWPEGLQIAEARSLREALTLALLPQEAGPARREARAASRED